jgi:ribonuclease E
MPKRMLIDAAHAEETRVVVLDGKKLEEFDFESSTKKQLKGNIYLAKVTRVEPSLQAAFLDYGGNRHGFLPFSEIHPDYYQIPVADRQALLHEEAEQQADLDAASDASEKRQEAENNEEGVESLGHDDELEEVRAPKARPRRNYKIQEVIKRRQIMLVQVVKEERGNKGAALTTYLSLAGRYCVLMPNTSRGGGISRKISSIADRKRLKSILSELDMPEGVACIIRTAGTKRTKPEIKRDYEYLLRLWDTTRQLTLKSMAPALIYEEGNLIKRAIRDVYSREIDEVLVEGEAGYRMAKDFMRLLMPSHSKKVQHYNDRIPLFHRYQVEAQLDSMFNPVVELRSGGYIVINPTEALVAVDVNSGRSTREHNIEETAYKTNLEAAEEISRQLRLRDMAGLVVVDFIDMEDNRNNRNVEKKMKDCLKSDRARIQVGRISHFGLMEMSRQRLRPGVLEASTQPCAICQGTGVIRSTESCSLQIIRILEEEGIKGRTAEVVVHVPVAVALFLLNEKRRYVAQLEDRFNFHIRIDADPALLAPNYRIERIAASEEEGEAAETAKPEPRREEESHAAEPAAAERPQREPAQAAPAGEGEEGRSRRRRRRRRRRGGRPSEEEATQTLTAEDGVEGEAEDVLEGEEHEQEHEPEEPAGEEEVEATAATGRRPRRRRRGRRSSGVGAESETALNAEAPAETVETVAEESAAIEAQEVAPVEAEAEASAPEAEAQPAKPRRRRSRAAKPEVEAVTEAAEVPAETAEPEARPEAPARRARRRKAAVAPAEPEAAAPVEEAPAEAPVAQEPATVPEAEPVEAPAEEPVEIESVPVAEAPAAPEKTPEPEKAPEPAKPARRGWWQRAKSVIE